MSRGEATKRTPTIRGSRSIPGRVLSWRGAVALPPVFGTIVERIVQAQEHAAVLAARV